MSDVINPAHYAGDEVQRFIEARELGFSLGNVIKYVARAGRKDGQLAVTDLRKAAWYLDREIQACALREAALGGEVAARSINEGERNG